MHVVTVAPLLFAQAVREFYLLIFAATLSPRQRTPPKNPFSHACSYSRPAVIRSGGPSQKIAQWMSAQRRDAELRFENIPLALVRPSGGRER